MSEPEAAVVRRQRVSAVWIVPAVAMLLGVWLVIVAYLGRGPVIEISFATAEGLEEGATTVQIRNVEVGLVSDIALAEDLSGVVVTAELTPETRPLLREDTRFWVVRPRFGTAGISGLDTIVSGAYIEMSSGIGEPTDTLVYRGLEQAPITPTGTPGLRVTLVSETSGSLGIGDPVLYRGYRVGRVEEVRLDIRAQELRYSLFIDAPYDTLVTTSSRFWNASGISVELTTEGAKLNLASLESLIGGGVAFDIPEAAVPGERARDDEVFVLYADEASIIENPHRFHAEYVVSVNQSVRGLSAGAPVTYRGIPVGRVQRIMTGEGGIGLLDEGGQTPIPVLIHIEPGRFKLDDSPEGVERLHTAIAQAVNNGLRATLESGNLLTGSLYVNLDFFENRATRGLGTFEDYPAIPSVSVGLGLLQQQLNDLMTKLNTLPLEATLETATAILEELGSIVSQVENLLADDALKSLPARLDASLAQMERTLSTYSDESGFPDELGGTLNELNRTLESVRALTDRLERDPNSLIFPSRADADPEPAAGRR